MANERGLVISCPIRISGTSLEIKTTALDPQELRFALLFWDKLDFPTNNMISIGLDQQAEFLASEGILTRTRVQVQGGGEMTKIFPLIHTHAYRTLDKQEPGVWSLGAGENSVSFPDTDVEDGRGGLVRLYQAIPVPDKEVPLQDILEFREKRHAELLALRHHIEAIYQRVIAAGDGELSLNTEIGSLEQSIADYIKASQESKMSFRNMSFDASLNIPAGFVAGLAAYSVPLGVVGTLLTGFAAAISFGPGKSLKSHSVTPMPFQYISSYHEKIF